MGLWDDIVRRGTTGDVRKEDQQKDEIGDWMLEYLMGDEELKKQHSSIKSYVFLYKGLKTGRRFSGTQLEGLYLKPIKDAVDVRCEVITAMFKDMEKGEFDKRKEYRTPLWNKEVRYIKESIERHRMDEELKDYEKLLDFLEDGYWYDLRAISKLCKQ